MTMSAERMQAEGTRDPYGWRAATVRVLANALLVLLLFEVVSIVEAVVTVVGGAILPVPLPELLPMLAVFLLVRWLFLLPGLVLALLALDYVARRAAHPRVVVGLVALLPAAVWEMTRSPSDFPSEEAVILAVTALLFAFLARLPPGIPGHGGDDSAGVDTARGQPDSAVADPATSPRERTPDPGSAPDRP
jgi:hypothetical protein